MWRQEEVMVPCRKIDAWCLVRDMGRQVLPLLATGKIAAAHEAGITLAWGSVPSLELENRR